MTAVAVQQRPSQPQVHRQSPHSSKQASPHTSRPQSYTNTPSSTADNTLNTSAANGGPSNMNTRPVASAGPSRTVNGNGNTPTDTNGASAQAKTNGALSSAKATTGKENSRPTSEPGGKNKSINALRRKDSLREDSETDQEPRRQRPLLLLRSKSDFGPRSDDSDSQRHDSDGQDWGARHGFEDHYASEEYVSQLANVCRSFLPLCTYM